MARHAAASYATLSLMPRRLLRFAAAAAAAATLLAARPALAQQNASFPRADGKTVPVTVYSPSGGTCLGVAIISPGAGGSERGYAYLGRGLAAQGYLSLVVGHQESGLAALRRHMRGRGLQGGLESLVTDPSAYDGRFMDIAAARRWAAPRCAGRETILLGHSMGAATVMIEAGAKNELGVSGADDFDVYVALSPQGVGTIFPAGAWHAITKPVLIMTGTRDTELGGLPWQTRTQPFYDMAPGCKWLGVVSGATHMDFARTAQTGPAAPLVLQTIRAFLTAVHAHDCSAPPAFSGMTLTAR